MYERTKLIQSINKNVDTENQEELEKVIEGIENFECTDSRLWRYELNHFNWGDISEKASTYLARQF